MKHLTFYRALIFFACIFGLSECTVQKRAYRNGYFVSWNKKAKSTNKKTVQPVETNTAPEKEYVREEIATPFDEKEEMIASAGNGKNMAGLIPGNKRISFLTDSCGDLITLRNGDEIKARVIEVSDKGIKYKRCDNLDGPLIVVNTANVFMIKYSNGTKEVFKKEETTSPASNKPGPPASKKINPWAIASLVIGCLFFIIYISPLALIFGIVAINQINRNPDRWEGRGLAIAGIVLGTIGLLILLLVLTFLL